MAKRSVDILIQGHDRVSKHFRSAGKSSDFLNTRLRRLVISAGSLAAGFVGVRAIMRGLGEALRFGDELAKTSQKLGTSTEGLAKLRYAGELTGVAMRTLDMGIQRMTRRLAEAAQGTGEAKAAIAELGLDAKSLAEMSPDKAFGEIAAAMAKVPDQANRVRLSFKLFDSEGVALVNTLALGKAGLQKTGDELQRLGGVYSAQALAKLEQLEESMTKLKTAMKALSTQALIAVAGHLEGIANAATKTVTAFNEMSSATKKMTLGIAGSTGALIGLGAAARGLKWLKGGLVLLPGAASKMMSKLGVSIARVSRYLGGLLLKLEKASLIFSVKTFAALAAQLSLVGTIAAGTLYLLYKVWKGPEKRQLPFMTAQELNELGVKTNEWGDGLLLVAENAEKVNRRLAWMERHQAHIANLAAMQERSKANERAWERHQQAIVDRIAALKNEIDVLRFGRQEAELRALSQERLARGEKDRIATLIQQRNALEAIQKVQEQIASTAKRIWDATRTPIERYLATLAELRKVFAAGGISMDTMMRGIRQARETLRPRTLAADRPYTGVAAFESRFLTRVPGIEGRDPNVAIQRNTAATAKTAEKQLKAAQKLLAITEQQHRRDRRTLEVVEIA
jgi:hypothetical protein